MSILPAPLIHPSPDWQGRPLVAPAPVPVTNVDGGWADNLPAFLYEGEPENSSGWLGDYFDVPAAPITVRHRNHFGEALTPLRRPRAVWMLDGSQDDGVTPGPDNTDFWDAATLVTAGLTGTSVSSFQAWHTYTASWLQEFSTLIAEMQRMFGIPDGPGGLHLGADEILWGDVLFLISRDASGTSYDDAPTVADFAELFDRFARLRVVVCSLPLVPPDTYDSNDTLYEPYGVEFVSGVPDLLTLVRDHFDL